MRRIRREMMDEVKLYGFGDFSDTDPVVHMEAKGRWQVLKWNRQSRKYRVHSEYPTERQARAIKTLMEG